MPPQAHSFVVDCSITIPWYLEDESVALADKLLKLVGQVNAWVPAIWRLEFVNALLVAERRGRIDVRRRFEILDQAEHLPLIMDETRIPLHTIHDMAASHGLSAYDAAYLELAIRRSMPLATLDKPLAAAARKLKHPVIS